MESAIAVEAMTRGIGAAVSIMQSEYTLWRQKKIERKEEFRDANKKLRVAINKSMLHMEYAAIQTGSVRLYRAQTLADKVSEIVYELDGAAEEGRDVLRKEVYDAAKNLAKAFTKWQAELNPFKLRSTSGGTATNSALKENQKFRSYSPAEMLGLLREFYQGLEELD